MIVGVVGAGAMGRGIAQVAAVAGHEVLLSDADQDAVGVAMEAVSASLDRAVERGRVDRDDADAALARLSGVETLEGLGHCDLVIEAVVERLDVKQAVFTQLEAVVDPETVLATNTSSLSIATIAAALRGRNRVVGLHFFNPVPAMRLVEIISGPDTSSAVIERAKAWV